MPTRRLVWKEAAGVVGAITPWNAPVQINLAKCVAALGAGCTVILKAAPETPWSAALIGEAAAATDLPPGVLNVITGSDKTALGAQLVEDPRVDVISFTGSTATGRTHHGRGCRQREARVPGVGRQVRQHPARRCRFRPGALQRARRLLSRGAGLQHPDPDARATHAARGSSRDAQDHLREPALRRSGQPRADPRACDLAGAPRAGAGLRRHG